MVKIFISYLDLRADERMCRKFREFAEHGGTGRQVEKVHSAEHRRKAVCLAGKFSLRGQ